MKLYAALTLVIFPVMLSQSHAQNPGQNQTEAAALQNPTISSESTLVLVPALVRDKAGGLIFGLDASDFTLTDDGVPQTLTLERDTGSEPLALVIAIEGEYTESTPHGARSPDLDKYRAIAPMLEALIGGGEHKIAVVGFDSSPVLVQNFTPDTNTAARAVREVIADNSGDGKAAILDSIGFSVDLLRKQPPQYRRAILLLSETLDRGSKVSLDEALRAVGDTNTVIYAIAFSSVRDYMKLEAPKTFGQGLIPFLSSKDPVPPGPAHGCMSRDPSDPQVDFRKGNAGQAYDCLSLLAPPLRLAKMAVVAARDGFERNVPETIAQLTGGEYFKLEGNSLEHDLNDISNHIPNRYVLSFQPQSPHPGFHSISLAVRSYANPQISARNGYWADTGDASSTRSPSRSK